MSMPFEEIVKFHGHLCPGVTSGYLLSKYALELIDAKEGENLYCIAEAKNCMIDGIQCTTGCTIGKGNLAIDNMGRFAITLVKAETGKGVRVYADISSVQASTKPEIAKKLMEVDFKTLCKVEKAQIEIPPKNMGNTIVCENCGEKFSDLFKIEKEGKIICPKCAK